MLATELKSLLEDRANKWKFSVEGEGRNFQIEAISDDFDTMPRVKRQQAVLRLIADEIADGILHAITIKALTHEEKDMSRGFGL